ncbi:MAG: sensor histidine kinase [Microcoleaceae cyanobacterium]
MKLKIYANPHSLPPSMIKLLEKFLRHPFKLLWLGAGLTFVACVPPIWMTLQAYVTFNRTLQEDFRLRRLSDQITYLDEVLTMSALMNAATGDRQWEQRYDRFVPQLDATIQESIGLASDIYNNEDAKQTDVANQKLIELETQSFELVRQGRQKDAFTLLSSPQYGALKQQYKKGVDRRNQAIQTQLEDQVNRYRRQLIVSGFLSVLSLVLLSTIWLLVRITLKTHLKNLKDAQTSLADINENLEKLVQARSLDLSHKNTQLDQALSELQQTQLQVIQSEKMSALGQMMAGITHEINNPIGFLSGNLLHAHEYIQDLLEHLQLYQESYPNPGLKIQQHSKTIELDYVVKDLPDLISSMQVGAERIQDISRSMRIFSRADTEQKVTFNLHEGIDSTLLILKHRLKANQQRPEIKIIKNYDNLPEIQGFPGQLNQVFMNILANSIDVFDEMSEIQAPTTTQADYRITIQTEEILAQKIVAVRIRDNGCGMPESVSARIFDNLFTTKAVGKGTGLGLSIAKQIVEKQHDGKLICNSQPNQGTEFVIELPL